MLMDSPAIGMALAEAMLRGMDAERRWPMPPIILHDPFWRDAFGRPGIAEIVETIALRKDEL